MIKFLVFAIHLTYALAGNTFLDNNSFFIYNKEYHKAKISQWGTGAFDIGTKESSEELSEVWTLQPHPTTTGYYYIINAKRPRYRIADWKHKMIVYPGGYNDNNDQLELFKFDPHGHATYADYYYIRNCYYPRDRIAKFGSGNVDVAMYDGPLYDDQLWKLVPRFEVSMYNAKIFSIDNRQGINPIQQTIKYTKGVKRTTTNSISGMESYTSSIEASLSVAYGSVAISTSVKQELTGQLTTSFSSTSEESWLKEKTFKFTVPAQKNYKIVQHTVDFDGKIAGESCSLMGDIKVFESNTADFPDPDNFLIISETEELRN